MYECVCGYSAATATAFHGHLTATACDGSSQHRLATKNNRYSRSSRSAAPGAAPGALDAATTQGQQQQQQVVREAALVMPSNRSTGAGQPSAKANRASASSGYNTRSTAAAAAGGDGGSREGGAMGIAGLLTDEMHSRSAGNAQRRYQSYQHHDHNHQQQQQPLSVPSSIGDALIAAVQGYGWLSGSSAGRAASAAAAEAVSAAAAAPRRDGEPTEAPWGPPAAAAGAATQHGEAAEPCWYSALHHAGGGAFEKDADATVTIGRGGGGGAKAALPRGTRAGRQGRASASGDGTAGGAGPHGEAVRDLLLWRDPGASAQALGFGLYFIMLVGYLPRGVDYMQITSLLPGAALLLLAYNLAKRPVASAFAKVSVTDPSAARAALSAAESRAAAHAAALAADAARGAAAAAGGALALCGRALRGSSPTGTAWTAAFLWSLMLVSELRVIPQLLLAMLAYAVLFCVPWLYAQFKETMDEIVNEVLCFSTLLVAGCSRATLAASALAGLVAWQLAEAAGAGLVVRISGGAAAAFAALVWRAAAA